MAMIKDLQVQCEKDMMRVRILFDRPFYGMVFSKGHYSNINCVHVPSGLGQTQVSETQFLHFLPQSYDSYPCFFRQPLIYHFKVVECPVQ